LVLLGIVWAGALLGVLHAIFFVNSFRALNAALYVVLGCSAVPMLPYLGSALGATRTGFLVAGGVIYVIGAVVYSRRRPNPFPTVFGYHEVFHLMVIAASVLHFAAVYGLVATATLPTG
jgi:hemolysin III